MPYVGPANTTYLQKRQKLKLKKKERPPSKLPNIVIFEMMAVAILLDACEWGLDYIGVGEILNPIIDWTIVPLGFYIWFKTRGVNLNGARKSITFLAGAFIDGLEASAIPLWTLDIGLVIFFQRAEEAIVNNSELINKGLNAAKTAGRLTGNKEWGEAADQAGSFVQRAQREV